MIEVIQRLFAEPALTSIVVQPIIDMQRALVVGYEALSRFALTRDTEGVFLTAARNGLGVALEALVIARALELRRETPPDCFFTINVDPQHLLAPEVRTVLDAEPSIDGLVLELTEHRLIDNVPAVVKVLDDLRKRGVLVAVDDAGAGYSGLQQILSLRPQFVKLDRALIQDLHIDAAKRALVQMLGELAGRLDAWIIAEGIETEAELRELMALGVPLAQGWFLARPAPPWGVIRPEAWAPLASAQVAPKAVRVMRDLIESCHVCAGDEPWADVDLAVRVSADGRPIALRCEVNGERFERDGHEIMRVKVESTLASIARRAVTRTERVRWDPLVCIDDFGHLRGIVRMSRLVTALAEAQETMH